MDDPYELEIAGKKLFNNIQRMDSLRDTPASEGTPKEKAAFLDEVFSKSGYSYSMTIKHFATNGVSIYSQDEFAMAMFVLMPVMTEDGFENPEKAFSGDTLADVKKLIKIMEKITQ
jgi:hypothetical protein